MGNRTVAQFKAKLGQAPSHTEEDDLDEEAQTILKDIRVDYRKMMDGVKKITLATFKSTPLLSTFTEFSLVQQYLDLEASEKHHFANLGKILLEYPIYTEFLQKIKGVGPAMAGVIISEINIRVSKYPSSLWQYAGLGVEADGKGTSRRKEHMHPVRYMDKEGNEAERQGIRYNPFLKTKLMGVLASSFLRAGAVDNPYREHYDNYKKRVDSHVNWTEESKGHKHRAALRFMIQRFLVDLYNAWRRLENLPVAPEYSEAKLGMIHNQAEQDHLHPEITAPAPFIRHIRGPGNVVQLECVTKDHGDQTGSVNLTDAQYNEWLSPMTGQLFKVAARSIVRELAYANKGAIALRSPTGLLLYTGKSS